jgi:hypothetical protein
MNHTSNRNQNLQHTTSSTVGVIDLTKENPSKVANTYYPIPPSKKQRRLETTNESADTRPQKRSRTEQVQERNLITPSIPNINQIPVHSAYKITNSRIAALYNTIIPADFTSTQILNGRRPAMVLPNNVILTSPSNYSPQYVSQNNNINPLESYNIGVMKPAMAQIPPQQPIAPVSSSNSTTSSNNASQEIIDLTTDSDDNDCIIDEQETNRDLCWGMINTEFLVLYPRTCTGGKGPEEVQLERLSARGQSKISFR